MKTQLKTLLMLMLAGGLMAETREVYVQHKAAHAVVGTAIAYTGHKLGYPKTGIALAWTAGIAKEVYDRRHGGRFRPGDAAWTAAPATVISISFKW